MCFSSGRVSLFALPARPAPSPLLAPHPLRIAPKHVGPHCCERGRGPLRYVRGRSRPVPRRSGFGSGRVRAAHAAVPSGAATQTCSPMSATSPRRRSSPGKRQQMGGGCGREGGHCVCARVWTGFACRRKGDQLQTIRVSGFCTSQPTGIIVASSSLYCNARWVNQHGLFLYSSRAKVHACYAPHNH